MRNIVIAIDGFSGTGKSSTAKEVASSLGYTYIDSGAMYRCVARYFINHQIDFVEEEKVIKALDEILITFRFNKWLNASEILLNNQIMDHQIRLPEINEIVSQIAAQPLIRKKLVSRQQTLGLHKSIVMDGRDIGTVVFPSAALKIFMIADLDVRSVRRQKELEGQGIQVALEEIKKNLDLRDHLDTTRIDSPLIKAADAITLDSSYLTFDDQVKEIIDLANKIIYEG
ncbi:MAG: (d)CMP kinase [Flammeovirgaceae bacterium]|jgi:CMP/dCMP kinase|nr:(d)CMP kinase [Flammeovirgaceae bacterium]